MATDQPTDATAARLRAQLRSAACQMGHAIMWGPATQNRDVYDAYDAALDTLIRYYRAVGAVEALDAVLATVDDNYGDRFAALALREARAAAQERLAAYEEDP